MRGWVWVLMVASSLTAQAQDAGFEWVQGGRLGNGMRVFGANAADEPKFVDASGHLAVLARDRQSVNCLDLSYNMVSTATAGLNETLYHFAYDASLSEVWLVSVVANSINWHVRLARYTCANGREAQIIDLPAEPIATLADGAPFASWVMSAGVVEYSARDGIYRVDTSVMTPTAQRVVSSQTVLTSLGEDAPLLNALQTIRGCLAVTLGARVCTVGTLVGQSVVTIDGTGLLVTRREGPLTGTSAPMGTSLVKLPTGDVLVFPWLSRASLAKKRWTWLGVIGSDERFRPTRPDKDTNLAVGGGLNRLMPAADGRPWVLIDGTLPNSTQYVDALPVTFDPARADLDLDGLSKDEEDALGTASGDDDTDHDGVNDGVEVQWFGTDPLDAGSRPPKKEPAWRWGYNAMVALPMPPGPQRGTPACPAHDPGPCIACRESNGTIRQSTGFCQQTGGAPNVTATTRDGKAEFIGVKETNTSTTFIALQRVSSDPVLFPSSVPVSAADRVYAVDENTVYQLGRLASGTRLVRFTPQGSEELSLQTGCPLQRTVPGCVERLRFGPLNSVDLLDTVGTRPAVFAHVQGSFGEGLVALDETGWHFLADVTDVGLLFNGLAFDAKQSELLFVGRGNLDQRLAETWRLGTDFDAHSLRRNELETSYGPFRPLRPDQVLGGGHGYPAQRQEEWFVDPEPGGGVMGCVSIGGVTLCDFGSFPSTPVPVPYVSMPPEELMPAEAALRAGDVLLAGYLGTWTTSSPWGFSKLDRRGTLTHWLSEAEFTALIDDATERDALVQSPLQNVISLGISPDGLSVCLVERTIARVWEVQLDPSTRLAAHVRRVPAHFQTRACGYDPQGRVVTATETEAKRDGVTLFTGIGGTQSFAWLGDRWAAWGLGRPVQCFDAAGHDDGGLGWDAVAVSPFAGGVAWVDMTGRAFAGTLDELCNKLNVPRERFVTDDRLTFNEVLSNDVFRPVSRRHIQFTTRGEGNVLISTQASLVMRPDGLGVFGAWNRWAEGLGFNTPLKGPDATFFFEPALQPKDLGKRWPQFDAFRRAEFTWTFLAALASPMVLVPGADATGEWGRYGPIQVWAPDGGWPANVEPAGGGGGATGGGGGGTGGGAPNPPGCSCGQVDLAALVLGVTLLLRRRAARR
ncbi:MAG: hypothetical protein U0228_22495 [Myxococcaceae bacterium]